MPTVALEFDEDVPLFALFTVTLAAGGLRTVSQPRDVYFRRRGEGLRRSRGAR